MQSHTSNPDRSTTSARVPTATARLVTAAARGDQHAWEQIVERYSGLLWAVVRAHRLPAGDAADVVQTSWLRLVEHLDAIRNPDGIGRWLATTARRECLRTLKRTARCDPVEDIERFADADPGELDAALLAAERDAVVHGATQRSIRRTHPGFSRSRVGDSGAGQAAPRMLKCGGSDS